MSLGHPLSAPGLATGRPAPPGVLVVEDEALVAMVVERALEQSGYHVCGVAADQAEALRLAARNPPDFAVVDLMLGDRRDGLGLGRALAQRGVAVLFASAYGLGFRQEMEDAGGRAILAKPYAAEDVPQALAALERLGRGEAPRQVPAGFHLFVD